MKKLKFEWNIPNLLSLVRLALIPVFSVLYLNSENNTPYLIWSLAVLLLSGVTDVLDGYFARRYNQITELGKLLDPIVDKITQLTVLLCLAVRYKQLQVLLAICLVKELLQIIGSILLVSRHNIVKGARWFGKVSTFTFYGAMLIVLVWPSMPETVLWVLVGIVTVTMLFSLYKYTEVYLRSRNEAVNEDQ